MASFSKQFLSGSTNGRGIKVAANATPGTTIHTASTADKDEVWCWITNTSASDVVVTAEFGGVTAPDDNIKTTVPAGEVVLLIPGLILSGTLLFKVFGATANVLVAHGFVNRITG